MIRLSWLAVSTKIDIVVQVLKATESVNWTFPLVGIACTVTVNQASGTLVFRFCSRINQVGQLQASHLTALNFSFQMCKK